MMYNYLFTRFAVAFARVPRLSGRRGNNESVGKASQILKVMDCGFKPSVTDELGGPCVMTRLSFLWSLPDGRLSCVNLSGNFYHSCFLIITFDKTRVSNTSQCRVL
jgi:hypothetical protein